MNKAVAVARWNPKEWTQAPLRLEIQLVLPAPSHLVFASLTDPEEMCAIFAWMHKVVVDHQTIDTLQVYGLGTKRRCFFGNGMVLEEVIVGWEPPLRYAYLGVDATHPFGMVGHLGIIICNPHGTETELLIQHYFDHPNPPAMCQQLEISLQQGLERMQERFRKQSSNQEKSHDNHHP